MPELSNWLRQRSRRIFFGLVRFSCIPRLCRELIQRRKITIVVFHAPSADLAKIYVRALQSRYTVISLLDYVEARRSDRTHLLPSKALIITVDDGHKSNYELKSLLEAFHLKVTIFLCSGIVGTHRHFWWFHAKNQSEIQRLKNIANEERVRILQQDGHWDTREYDHRQALSKTELGRLATSVDFQAHTVFHPILPACSEQEARWEIRQSKADLESLLACKIHALAYPNGDYSEREARIARDAGYECAVTLDSGFNDNATDLFRLKRIPLPDDCDINELLVKASGIWSMISQGRNVLFKRRAWAQRNAWQEIPSIETV